MSHDPDSRKHQQLDNQSMLYKIISIYSRGRKEGMRNERIKQGVCLVLTRPLALDQRRSLHVRNRDDSVKQANFRPNFSYFGDLSNARCNEGDK